jgi:hypothetical protein
MQKQEEKAILEHLEATREGGGEQGNNTDVVDYDNPQSC